MQPLQACGSLNFGLRQSERALVEVGMSSGLRGCSCDHIHCCCSQLLRCQLLEKRLQLMDTEWNFQTVWRPLAPRLTLHNEITKLQQVSHAIPAFHILHAVIVLKMQHANGMLSVKCQSCVVKCSRGQLELHTEHVHVFGGLDF